MFKQYIYSKHTLDAIILQNQRPVAVHNTDFTSTKQFNLQNKEQTQWHLPNLGAPTDFRNFRGVRTPRDPPGSASVQQYYSRAFFFFEFSYTLRVGFLAKIRGNRRMRLCKNSTHSSVACPFQRTPAYIRIKVMST